MKSQSHILASWEEMKVKLKSLEQENERLKKEIEMSQKAHMGDLKTCSKNYTDLENRLKERDELIKEAIDLYFNGFNNDIWRNTAHFKWFEKAKKLVGEK